MCGRHSSRPAFKIVKLTLFSPYLLPSKLKEKFYDEIVLREYNGQFNIGRIRCKQNVAVETQSKGEILPKKVIPFIKV